MDWPDQIEPRTRKIFTRRRAKLGIMALRLRPGMFGDNSSLSVSSQPLFFCLLAIEDNKTWCTA